MLTGPALMAAGSIAENAGEEAIKAGVARKLIKVRFFIG